MKRSILTLLVSLILFGLAPNLYSQTLDTSILQIPSIITKYKKDLAKNNRVKDSLSSINFKENWDTIHFNPYDRSNVSFPFEISFLDKTYASPIQKKHVVTSRYGWRRGRAHRAIDIDLVTGDDVYSILDGKVRFVGYHPGHGKTIVVRHYNGLETVYAHLSEYNTKVNTIVKKGQLIGKGGNTGRSRGSHLHLEVRYKGIDINPEHIFTFKRNNNIRSKNVWVTKDWATPYHHISTRQSSLVTLDTFEKVKAYKKRKRRIYIVKSGDTLSGIAFKNRVPIRRICKANKIKKTSTLKIGQRLIL
ncbi:peptidoglycan DD-metalloendopeptidase family protein [Tenacibaculum sp. MEBiC06402]|uniref:peptidoglycan DD-metalloendopeptidase family protein n=1 Tax=unclassified Tenacibaculum TaxID=2635139 RepID=UPI003B9A17C2